MRVVMQQARPTEEDPREHRSLTTGETYFVIGVSNRDYQVIDDRGEPILFPKDIFQVVDRSIPPGWTFREFDDDEYRLWPAATGRPGFFEQWHGSSGDRPAELHAREILKQAIEEMRAHVDDTDRALIDRDLSRLAAAARRRG